MIAEYLGPVPDSLFMQLMLYPCLQGCESNSEIWLVEDAEPHSILLRPDDFDAHTASGCNPDEAV